MQTIILTFSLSLLLVGPAPMQDDPTTPGAAICPAQVLAGGSCGCCQINKFESAGINSFTLWYDCTAHEGWWGWEDSIPPGHATCGLQISTRNVGFQYFKDPSGML
ncbi:hypothetical protein H8D30_05830 [bacterium]|nr:hypothetical protein [bacterium]